ncbi:hypothetical protein KKD19_04585 [Patescibacteria group bacterium]|nr:hypothetical protein [Patescibacteria group bacterium]MBU4512485.1 hypothetical protein [Patescibacteria group bacterium]MCG2692809.1 hypothetical protein [Candidatus Parcubacteria bacterium]
MRKKIIFLVLVFGFLPMVSLAVMQTSFTLDQGQNLKEYREAKTSEQRVQKLQDIGENMIGRRISVIELAKNRFTTAQRISQAIKDKISLVLDDNVTNLNALKEDILAGDDLEGLKTKVKSIVTGYRVFVVVIPQSRGLVVADRLGGFKEKLVELKDKIQARAGELGGDEADTSGVEALIEQAGSKITEAEASLAMAEEKFSSMQVSDASGAKDLKSAGKQALVRARESLRAAKNDLREAAQALKELIKTQAQSIEQEQEVEQE